MSILSQFKQSQNTDFPNVRPSLDLKFALAKKLDPRITFTRGSTGTYFGSDGIMRTAGVNEPRFDHDPITGQSLGLLIEQLRFNLYTYSDIEGTVGEKPTNMNLFGPGRQTAVVSTDVSLGPNGQSCKHTRGTYSDNNVGYFGYGSHTLNLPYTASVYVYIPSSQAQNFLGKFIKFQVESVGASGVVDANVNIVDRWQRVSVTYTPTSETNVPIVARTNANAGSFFYTDCWQLEQASFPTSYMPASGGSQFTRSADLAQMTGTNFSSWYNQSEGSIIVNCNKPYPVPSNSFLNIVGIGNAISGAGRNEINVGYLTEGLFSLETYRNNVRIVALYPGSSNIRTRISGVSYNQTTDVYYLFTNNKTSASAIHRSYKQNIDFGTDLNTLYIGNNIFGSSNLCGTISRLTYYPIQLTNQQLINLTS